MKRTLKLDLGKELYINRKEWDINYFLNKAKTQYTTKNRYLLIFINADVESAPF